VKIPVSVIAVYVGDGFSISRIPVSSAMAAEHRVIPLRILTCKDEKIIIDRITDISRMASTKAGGLGERYTCLATFGEIQQEIYVYKDEDSWYLEENFY